MKEFWEMKEFWNCLKSKPPFVPWAVWLVLLWMAALDGAFDSEG